MTGLKRFILILVATISMVLMPMAANAFTLLECGDGLPDTNNTPLGYPVPNTSLFDADPSSDPSSGSGECQYYGQPILQHVFSSIVCQFVQILNTIMDSMYCGMNYYLITIMTALVTLYLTVYGAQVAMGTARVSTRDSIIRMLKISFIYVFATQATWGISYIFTFFMSVITTTTSAVLSTLSRQVAAQGDGICSFAGLNSQDFMTMYSFLDYLVCHAFLGGASQVSSKIQGLMLAMAVGVGPVTVLFQWWFITTLKTLIITLVSFMKALAAIAFLVTLSPFFLGFFLFQSTTYIFENWLRYLISYSVQTCIVIAIIVLWILSVNQFVTFFQQLANLVYPLVLVKTEGAVYQAADTFAICPPTYNTDQYNEPTAWCTTGTQLTSYPPNLQCNGATARFDANPPVCPNPPLPAGQDCQMQDNGGTQLYPGCYCPSNPSWQCDQINLIPPAQIVNQGPFIYFVVFHFITLLLITYCFSVMLEQSDKLARSLAGPSSVPTLVPGWGKDIGSGSNFKTPGNVSGRPGDDPGLGALSQQFSKDSGSLVGRR